VHNNKNRRERIISRVKMCLPPITAKNPAEPPYFIDGIGIAIIY